MAGPVWECTVEEFRAAAGGSKPAPAAVAISAVSASFGLSLLAKVLRVSGNHKDFEGDSAKLQQLREAAAAQAMQMMRLAEEDMEAFNAWFAGSRLPRNTEAERQARQRVLDSSSRKAIEIPLTAARSAASGIELCADALNLTHPVVIADLGAATSLLASALRVFLMCADSNLSQISDGLTSSSGQITGRAEWEHRAYQQADSVLKGAAAVIAGGCQPK